MPSARRWFRSKRVYEMCFRAKEGLPLPALKTIRVLLESALARTQRDNKVDISHGLFMSNHPHMLVVSKQGVDLKRFHEELKKKITDAVKRLLGLEHLEIWEEAGTTIAELLTIDRVVERIAYFYLNPSNADLVDTISEYPGFSTWEVFQQNIGKLDGAFEKECPWIRLPSIPKLPSKKLTENQDAFFSEKMLKANKKSCILKISPNAWMKVFGITADEDVRELNERIVEKVLAGEELSRQRRKAAGKKPAGAFRLRTEAIYKAHTPKKKSRKIYVLSSDAALRVAFLQEFKEFCEKCSECYRAWKRGDWTVLWPAGAFRPPMPPAANALCWDS